MNSSSDEPVFLVTLKSLLANCWSNDPSRRLICVLASAQGILTGVPMLVFLLVGLPGNAVAAYALLASKRDKSRQSVYLGAMFATNCGLLTVYGLFHFFLPYGLPWLTRGQAGFILINASSLACTVNSFLESWLTLLSYGLFTAMVCDRTLAMHWPFKFQTLGWGTAARASAAVCLAAAAVSAYAALTAWTTDARAPIACRKPRAYKELNIVYGTGLGFPPALFILLILVANVTLVRRVLLICRRRRCMLAAAATTVKGAARGKPDGSVRSCVVCLVLSLAMLVSSVPCAVATAAVYSLAAMPGTSGTLLQTAVLLCNASEVGIIYELCVRWILLAWQSPEFRRRLAGLVPCLESEQLVSGSTKS